MARSTPATDHPARRLGRWTLAQFCRTAIPGRYLVVEALAPLLMPPGPVAAKVGGGLRFTCELRDLVQRQIYYGLYEPDETRFLMSLLRPGDVFLDIGANVGYYTLLAAEIVGESGRVYAFEPVPQNFALLTDNVRNNGITNVVLNQMAVSDGSSDHLTLYLRSGAENSGWASVATSTKYENVPVDVPAIALDAWLAANQIDRVTVIKIDIEGAEVFAFTGAAQLLARTDAPDIVCEINPFLLGRVGIAPSDLKRLIAGHGYRLFEITAGGLAPLDAGSDEARLTNIFATKRPDRVQA